MAFDKVNWKCTQCTFLNVMKATACSICGAEKDISVPKNDQQHNGANNDNKQISQLCPKCNSNIPITDYASHLDNHKNDVVDDIKCMKCNQQILITDYPDHISLCMNNANNNNNNNNQWNNIYNNYDNDNDNQPGNINNDNIPGSNYNNPNIAASIPGINDNNNAQPIAIPGSNYLIPGSSDNNVYNNVQPILSGDDDDDDEKEEVFATCTEPSCLKQIPIKEYNDHLLLHKSNKSQPGSFVHDNSINNAPGSGMSIASMNAVPGSGSGSGMSAIPGSGSGMNINHSDYIFCTEPFCGKQIPSYEYDDHLLVHKLSQASTLARQGSASSFLIPCDYPGCTLQIAAKDYDAHVNQHKNNDKANNDKQQYITCTEPSCKKLIPANEYNDHLLLHKLSRRQLSVEFDLIPCEYPDCNLKIAAKDYDTHILYQHKNVKKEKQFKICMDPLCTKQIPLDEYEDHLLLHKLAPVSVAAAAVIPGAVDLIPCDYPGCNLKIALTDWESHILEHNNKKQVTIKCKVCDLDVPVDQYNDHLVVHDLINNNDNSAKSNINDKASSHITCDFPGCNQQVLFEEYQTHQASHQQSPASMFGKQQVIDLPSPQNKDHNAAADDNKTDIMLIACDYITCNEQVPFDKYIEHQQKHKDDEQKINDVCIECDYPKCNKSIPFREYDKHQQFHKEEADKLQQKIDNDMKIYKQQKDHDMKMNAQQQKNDDLQQQLMDMRRELERVKTAAAAAKQASSQSQSSDAVHYPRWWNVNDDIKYNRNYASVKLIPLNIYSNDIAKKVIREFNKTATNQRVIKIESVQNRMLYDKWYHSKQSLVKLIGINKINERNLFHGTKREDVMTFIEKEGFRKEFNTTAMYGKGTYFARDAKYSVNYSTNKNGIRKMFYCKVVCGESIRGNKKYELRAWPKKHDGLIYDSLVNNMGSPSIFVIHENSRAYPMFVISFRKK